MKKRLLAMLLAVVTTVTSVPTPVFAASDNVADEVVVDETDAAAAEEAEETTAAAEDVTATPTPAAQEEATPAEEQDADAEEAVTTEAADEATETVTNDETNEAETVAEETTDDQTAEETTPVEENNAVEINAADGSRTVVGTVDFDRVGGDFDYADYAKSLYGPYNTYFAEGEWDYQGGIYDDKVIYAGLKEPSAALDAKNWSLFEKDGEEPVKYTFSIAPGWNKDLADGLVAADKSGLTFTEIKPGAVTDIKVSEKDGKKTTESVGLQVSANTSWLYEDGAHAKIVLTECAEKDDPVEYNYYIDNDKALWIYDSMGIARYVGVTNEDETWDDESNYGYFSNGAGNLHVYRDKKDGPYYRYDDDHNTLGDKEDNASKINGISVNSISVVSVNKAGVYTLRAEATYVVSRNTIPKKGGKAWEGTGTVETVTMTDVGYATIFVRLASDPNAGWENLTYTLPKKISDGKEAYEDYIEVNRTFDAHTENYSKVAGLQAGAQYKVTWNVNGSPASGLYTADANGAFNSDKNWAPNDGNLGVKEQKRITVYNLTGSVNSYTPVYDDYGNILNANYYNWYDADGTYHNNECICYDYAGAEWLGEVLFYTPVDNQPAYDENGQPIYEYSNGGITLTKVFKGEANGNCDSYKTNLPLDKTGAAFFDKTVISGTTTGKGKNQKTEPIVAPGVNGDKDSNDYDAEKKFSVKIGGLYGDHKFLYMKNANNNSDVEAAGYSNGIAFTADAAKGTMELYPAAAGINSISARVQYATESKKDGVTSTGAAITDDCSPVVMVVKEADPQGIISGVNSYKVPEKNLLVVSNLQYGDYRLRAVSNNSIIKDALYGDFDYGNGSVLADNYSNVKVQSINGEWYYRSTYAVFIDSTKISRDANGDLAVWLEKINDENEVLNSRQKLILSAENIYLNIVPPIAGHTSVSADDVEKGILAVADNDPEVAAKNPNYGIGNTGWSNGINNMPNPYKAFYNVKKVEWDLEAGKTFEKDKVYKATVTMSISKNGLSENIAFKKDLKKEDIFVNRSAYIDTDAGRIYLAVDSKNISDPTLGANNEELTFTVTFDKAFIPYEVHRIDVYDGLNERYVTGSWDGGLADPVIYIDPAKGNKATIYVYATNTKGHVPSVKTISYNAAPKGVDFLWDDESYATNTYTRNYDDGYDIRHNEGYSYAKFTVSANGTAAAGSEETIEFTAQYGEKVSRPITIRYYEKAKKPEPKVEYDRKIEFAKDDARNGLYAVITSLEKNTWYIISWDSDGNGTYDSSNYCYADGNAEIVVMNNAWYTDGDDNKAPLKIQTAFGEAVGLDKKKNATSDPAYLVLKEKIHDTVYVNLAAPVDGQSADAATYSHAHGTYSSAVAGSVTYVSANEVKWTNKDGSAITGNFEKDKEYRASFLVKIDRYAFDKNNVYGASYESNAETNYRGLENVTFVVPGAVADSVQKTPVKDLPDARLEYNYSVISVNAVFKAVETGKVPAALIGYYATEYKSTPTNEYAMTDVYKRSANGYAAYALSEGWGEEEGEIRVRNQFPYNSDIDMITYTDTTESVKVISSDKIYKLNSMISANKVTGEDAQIKAKIKNADGSEVDNAFVLDTVYVKCKAPYDATNTEDSNYISNLEENAWYTAYGYDDDDDDTFYRGQALKKEFENNMKEKVSLIGFKRLTCWDKNKNFYISKWYGEKEDKYASVYAKVNLTTLVPKKGLYVTWPDGASTDNRVYTYNGGAQTPNAWVWYDGVKIGDRVDQRYCKITYKNNTNANVDADGKLLKGKKYATINVSGKNGVKGKANPMNFTIEPANIALNTSTYATAGYAQTITVKKGTTLKGLKLNLYWNNGNYSKALKKNKDYTVDSMTSKFDSDSWIVVTGKGNFKGTKLIKVIVVDKLQKLSIKLTDKKGIEYNYYRDGLWVVKPSMTVTAGSQKLTETLDYNIFVETNPKNGPGAHNVGTYKVYVMGQGIYGGKFVKKSFKIKPKKLKPEELKAIGMEAIKSKVDGYAYDGIKGTTLSDGLNGTPELRIVANNVRIAGCDENGFDDDYGYDSGLKWISSVSIKYSKNKKLGTASYTIKFGGNFKGTKPIKGGSFKIAPNAFNIENEGDNFNGNKNNVEKIIIPDVAYTGKAGTYYSNVFMFYERVEDGTRGYLDYWSTGKHILYKNKRDYTVRYFKDETLKDEITNKNKLELVPGQEYATVYVKIEGKGGYALTTDGKAGSLDYKNKKYGILYRNQVLTYRVYDPKKVQGGCIDLKSMKYYNGEAKPVKVSISKAANGYKVTTGSGKKMSVITNNMGTDGYNFTGMMQWANIKLDAYGDLENGRVVGYKTSNVKLNGVLEKAWFN